jgi:hypothetical protein
MTAMFLLILGKGPLLYYCRGICTLSKTNHGWSFLSKRADKTGKTADKGAEKGLISGSTIWDEPTYEWVVKRA